MSPQRKKFEISKSYTSLVSKFDTYPLLLDYGLQMKIIFFIVNLIFIDIKEVLGSKKFFSLKNHQIIFLEYLYEQNIVGRGGSVFQFQISIFYLSARIKRLKCANGSTSSDSTLFCRENLKIDSKCRINISSRSPKFINLKKSYLDIHLAEVSRQMKFVYST